MYFIGVCICNFLLDDIVIVIGMFNSNFLILSAGIKGIDLTKPFLL